MKSHLPKNNRRSTPSTASKGQGFEAVNSYPTAPATEHLDQIAQVPAAQLKPHPQGGVVQLKGWEWKKATGTWVEVDAAEKGKAVPADVKGDGDGEVYDADTKQWYQNVEKYKFYTTRIANPAFKSKSQDMAVIFELMSTQDKGVGAFQGAAERLGSFLQNGVMTPGALGGKATTSADEKESPNKISVNKFGPFASAAQAAETAAYATMHAANGAIPVVMENSADVIGQDEEPDAAALAMRAHNSALAIIDPTKLDASAHMAIKLAGTGEMSLSSSIPSACFVAVLMPIALMRLVNQADITKFNIQFVGSKTASVSYNFKTKDKGKGHMDTKVSIPDYEQALSSIFEANPGSIFLTHVIRLSPKAAIAVNRSSSQSATAASTAAAAAAATTTGSVNSGAVVASAMAEQRATASASSTDPKAAVKVEDAKQKGNEKSATAEPSPSAAPEKTVHAIALAVCSRYPAGTASSEDAGITGPDDLFAKHAAEGVTNTNKQQVFDDLADFLTWMS